MQQTAIASRSRISIAALVAGALLFGLLLAGRAAALKAITIDMGYGLEDARLLRLNFGVSDHRPTPTGEGWSWHQYWEANLSYWYLYKHKKGVRDLFELGITPNFRIERVKAWRWGRPYLEAGVGVHLLSKVHIGARNLGSSFQFGSHAGLGIRLKEPNPGINFGMVRFGYRW